MKDLKRELEPIKEIGGNVCKLACYSGIVDEEDVTSDKSSEAQKSGRGWCERLFRKLQTLVSDSVI